MPIRTLNDCDDVLERHLVREIAEQGWTVVHSTDPAPRGLFPNVAYTVGLWQTHEHPELLVFGLAPEQGQALLKLVCEEVAKGQRFTSLEQFTHLLEGHSCRFQALGQHFHREHLAYCRWFYRGDGFKALQLMWPDAQGHFPDEAAFDAYLAAHQPVLVN